MRACEKARTHAEVSSSAHITHQQQPKYIRTHIRYCIYEYALYAGVYDTTQRFNNNCGIYVPYTIDILYVYAMPCHSGYFIVEYDT